MVGSDCWLASQKNVGCTRRGALGESPAFPEATHYSNRKQVAGQSGDNALNVLKGKRLLISQVVLIVQHPSKCRECF